MEVYHGKIYMPIVFGNAAPGQCFVFCRVEGHILVEMCALCRPHFLTDLHHSQIYTPIVCGDAALSVPSFIGSKVIFWFIFLCAL